VSAQAPRATNWRVDLDAAHLTGDYGLGEEVSLDVLTARVRYRAGRSEIRLSLPYLRLDGAGSIVGGTPTGGLPGSQGPPGSPAASPSASASGPGDVSLRFDFDVLQGGERKPWLTALIRAKFPTADEAAGLGTGETDLEGGLLFTQPLGAFSVLLEGRFTKVGDPDGIDYDDVKLASVGLARRLGARSRSSAYGFWEYRSHPIGGREARQSASVGASWRVGSNGRTRWTTGVFAGLTETAEDWGLQVVLSRQF